MNVQDDKPADLTLERMEAAAKLLEDFFPGCGFSLQVQPFDSYELFAVGNVSQRDASDMMMALLLSWFRA